MADQSTRIGLSGSESFDSQSDTVTLEYEVQYDSIPTNFYVAIARARAATGEPVPARRSLYATSSALLLARTFSADIDWKGGKKTLWKWTVTFGPPPQGEGGDGDASIIENPLERPPVFNIEYMDTEKVLDKARNVEALSHGDGKGGNRAANTEGPIVNAAGKRPDEPVMVSDRTEVLVIKRNYPDLATISGINSLFKRTTNSDSPQGYSARQLRYLLTSSDGVQNENGYEFWPGTTTILAEDTTDLIIDNVGYDYWDAGDADWVRVLDADGQPVAEPVNLKLDGDKGGDNSTTITYRYLTETEYAVLFEPLVI